MTDEETFKLPRIHTGEDLTADAAISLESAQAHYFKTVLRRQDGDLIRLFNGRDGEWLGVLEALAKKSGQVKLQKQLLAQPQNGRRVHLIFAPIKKHRMDWLVEKAVELGATDLHPVLTQNTEVRKLNDERVRQQIFEAAEQCERLEIPVLHDLKKLNALLSGWSKESPLLACVERFDAKPIADTATGGDVAILIGPEGGFTAEEKELLAKNATPVSLGETVLRCETAAVKALCLVMPS